MFSVIKAVLGFKSNSIPICSTKDSFLSLTSIQVGFEGDMQRRWEYTLNDPCCTLSKDKGENTERWLDTWSPWRIGASFGFSFTLASMSLEVVCYVIQSHAKQKHWTTTENSEIGSQLQTVALTANIVTVGLTLSSTLVKTNVMAQTKNVLFNPYRIFSSPL